MSERKSDESSSDSSSSSSESSSVSSSSTSSSPTSSDSKSISKGGDTTSSQSEAEKDQPSQSELSKLPLNESISEDVPQEAPPDAPASIPVEPSDDVKVSSLNVEEIPIISALNVELKVERRSSDTDEKSFLRRSAKEEFKRKSANLDQLLAQRRTSVDLDPNRKSLNAPLEKEKVVALLNSAQLTIPLESATIQRPRRITRPPTNAVTLIKARAAMPDTPMESPQRIISNFFIIDEVNFNLNDVPTIVEPQVENKPLESTPKEVEEVKVEIKEEKKEVKKKEIKEEVKKEEKKEDKKEVLKEIAKIEKRVEEKKPEEKKVEIKKQEEKKIEEKPEEDEKKPPLVKSPSKLAIKAAAIKLVPPGPKPRPFSSPPPVEPETLAYVEEAESVDDSVRRPYMNPNLNPMAALALGAMNVQLKKTSKSPVKSTDKKEDPKPFVKLNHIEREDLKKQASLESPKIKKAVDPKFRPISSPPNSINPDAVSQNIEQVPKESELQSTKSESSVRSEQPAKVSEISPKVERTSLPVKTSPIASRGPSVSRLAQNLNIPIKMGAPPPRKKAVEPPPPEEKNTIEPITTTTVPSITDSSSQGTISPINESIPSTKQEEVSPKQEEPSPPSIENLSPKERKKLEKEMAAKKKAEEKERKKREKEERKRKKKEIKAEKNRKAKEQKLAKKKAKEEEKERKKAVKQ